MQQQHGTSNRPKRAMTRQRPCASSLSLWQQHRHLNVCSPLVRMQQLCVFCLCCVSGVAYLVLHIARALCLRAFACPSRALSVLPLEGCVRVHAPCGRPPSPCMVVVGRRRVHVHAMCRLHVFMCLLHVSMCFTSVCMVVWQANQHAGPARSQVLGPLMRPLRYALYMPLCHSTHTHTPPPRLGESPPTACDPFNAPHKLLQYLLKEGTPSWAPTAVC
jgi:hypothetical protein